LGGEAILCNDCTIIAKNSDRLAIVKMMLIALLVIATDRRKKPVTFCVKITQKRASSPPNWLPNGKEHRLSAFSVSHTTQRGKVQANCQTRNGIGLGSVVEPRFVCQARLATDGFKQNEQSENE